MPPEPAGDLTRRATLGAGLGLLTATAVRADAGRSVHHQLAALERRARGRLGVTALDTQTGASLAYRADERFRYCSTIKLLLSAAVLQQVDRGELRLNQPVRFGPKDLLDYAPVARARVREGAMPPNDVCAGAIELSDNTCGNLLFAHLGGPPGLTRWLRGIGDETTRSDRIEEALNDAPAGDPRDTTSPAAMLHDMHAILLGPALSPQSRARLIGWMQACQTGGKRLRAGLPASWRVGDKTGTWTGPPGASNDVAIVWPPGRRPILIAAYLTEATSPPAVRDATLAHVGALAARAFVPGAAARG